MDFIDEQHVAGFKIGQQRGQIARPLQHRTRGLAQVDLHFVGEDVGERGFAQARRAEDQHVVQRFGAFARGADENLHLLAHHRLANVVREMTRTDLPVERDFFGALAGRNQAGVRHVSWPVALCAGRMNLP